MGFIELKLLILELLEYVFLFLCISLIQKLFFIFSPACHTSIFWALHFHLHFGEDSLLYLRPVIIEVGLNFP